MSEQEYLSIARNQAPRGQEKNVGVLKVGTAAHFSKETITEIEGALQTWLKGDTAQTWLKAQIAKQGLAEGKKHEYRFLLNNGADLTDGQFDRASSIVVKAFQKMNGLQEDGEVGYRTLGRLFPDKVGLTSLETGVRMGETSLAAPPAENAAPTQRQYAPFFDRIEGALNKWLSRFQAGTAPAGVTAFSDAELKNNKAADGLGAALEVFKKHEKLATDAAVFQKLREIAAISRPPAAVAPDQPPPASGGAPGADSTPPRPPVPAPAPAPEQAAAIKLDQKVTAEQLKRALGAERPPERPQFASVATFPEGPALVTLKENLRNYAKLSDAGRSAVNGEVAKLIGMKPDELRLNSNRYDGAMVDFKSGSQITGRLVKNVDGAVTSIPFQISLGADAQSSTWSIVNSRVETSRLEPLRNNLKEFSARLIAGMPPGENNKVLFAGFAGSKEDFWNASAPTTALIVTKGAKGYQLIAPTGTDTASSFQVKSAKENGELLELTTDAGLIRLNLQRGSATLVAENASSPVIDADNSPRPPQNPGLTLPPGMQRAALTPDGVQWMSEHSRVAGATIRRERSGGLVNASAFLSPDAERILPTYSGQKDGTLEFATLPPNRAGQKFAFRDTQSGETWIVSTIPFYADQHPQGIMFSKDRVAISKAGSDGQIQTDVPSTEIFRPNGQIDFAAVREAQANARSNAESQQRDPAGIRRFDIGKEPIGFIGLIDAANDPVINGLRRDLQNAPGFYNSLGPVGAPRYNFVTNQGSESINVLEDPTRILRQQLEKMHEAGIRTFRINLAGHGNNQGIHFQQPDGRSLVLRPRDLRMILEDPAFKDSKFIIDTVACSGGNMAGMLESLRDEGGERGRIQLRVQTKPTGLNQEGRIASDTPNGIARPFSTYYNVFYFEALKSGRTDGEAHLYADRETKRLIPTDAEVWVSGAAGGDGTRSIATKGIRL